MILMYNHIQQQEEQEEEEYYDGGSTSSIYKIESIIILPWLL